MAEGDGTRSIIDLIVSLKTEGLGQLDNAKDKVNDAMNSMSSSSDELDEQTSELSSGIEENAAVADELGQSFMKATGQGLALLFAGRFLSQTFGGLSRSMFDMLGVTDMFSATIKTVLLPAFLAVQPYLIELMEAFMGLDENTKMVIGAFVLVATALAPIIMIVGQAAAMAAAFGIGLGAIATAAGVVVGALAILWAGFKIGMWIGDTLLPMIVDFAKKAWTWIKDMAGKISDKFWELVDKIGSAFGNVYETVKNKIGKALDWVVDKLSGVASAVFDGARSIGDKIITGIKKGINAGKDIILDAIAALIPGIGSDTLTGLISSASSRVGNAVSSFGVNDFVMKDGKLLKTHPNDVLFGMKNPDQLGRTGGGQNITINVDRPQLNNEMDVDRMVERIKKDLDRDTTGRSGLR